MIRIFRSPNHKKFKKNKKRPILSSGRKLISLRISSMVWMLSILSAFTTALLTSKARSWESLQKKDQNFILWTSTITLNYKLLTAIHYKKCPVMLSEGNSTDIFGTSTVKNSIFKPTMKQESSRKCLLQPATRLQNQSLATAHSSLLIQ